MAGYFTDPEQALDYIYDLLNDNKGQLGLRFVGYGDENLLPEYPAVVVSFNAPVDRTIHAIRQFKLEWTIQLTIHHARLDASHKTRTREDIQLAAGVRDKLHEDKKCGGGVVFSFVTSERPGIAADDRGQANVATMLIWQAESREVF